MAEYIEAKRNIVRHQGPGDRAVLNADNAIAAGFAEGLKSRVFRFSRLGEVERGTYLGEDGVLYGGTAQRASRSCRSKRFVCPATT